MGEGEGIQQFEPNHLSETIPPDNPEIFYITDKVELNYWLTKFVIEVHGRKDPFIGNYKFPIKFFVLSSACVNSLSQGIYPHKSLKLGLCTDKFLNSSQFNSIQPYSFLQHYQLTFSWLNIQKD